MSQTGKCLCGAVSFEIKDAAPDAGACHCDMCRRWTGGVFVSVTVPAGGLVVSGEDHLRTYTSSPWAERAFCDTCGSSLWYRVTAPGPHHGVSHLGLGALDAPSGHTLTTELFIDQKPDGYSFAQQTNQMTAAEVMAMFADS